MKNSLEKAKVLVGKRLITIIFTIDVKWFGPLSVRPSDYCLCDGLF